jgi:mRNA-degrading endonuclease toxin of MazEF toxin-antitoxin module
MKRGEVWRVNFPSVPGHTQAGIRPAVIVQEDRATASLTTVLVVPFTGTQAAARFPGTLPVQPGGNCVTFLAPPPPPPATLAAPPARPANRRLS